MRKFSALALPLVAMFALSACSSIGTLSDRREDRFANLTEFTETADDDLQGGIVPEDATTIDVAYFSDRPGAMLAYTSATGPAECQPGPLTGEPLLESNWWPSTEPPEGTVCGEWQVFAIGQRWYAWTS